MLTPSPCLALVETKHGQSFMAYEVDSVSGWTPQGQLSVNTPTQDDLDDPAKLPRSRLCPIFSAPVAQRLSVLAALSSHQPIDLA